MAEAKSSGALGFCDLLTIVFITLKLSNVIDWSWWWVTAPIWLPLAALISILLVILFVGAVIGAIFNK